MSNARNLARVVADTSGAIAATNLANAVPADGSITTAKLAANAVTDTKIASGSITKAKQASDALTVIKTRQYVFNTASTATGGSASWMDLGIYGDITPTYSNSIIKVEFIMPLSFGNQINNSMRVARRIGGGSFVMPSTTTATAISSRAQSHSLSFWGFGDNWSRNVNHIMTFYDNPATTSQCTYRAEMIGGGTTTVRIGYNMDTSSGGWDYATAPCIVILTELAAGVVETVDAV